MCGISVLHPSRLSDGTALLLVTMTDQAPAQVFQPPHHGAGEGVRGAGQAQRRLEERG